MLMFIKLWTLYWFLCIPVKFKTVKCAVFQQILTTKCYTPSLFWTWYYLYAYLFLLIFSKMNLSNNTMLAWYSEYFWGESFTIMTYTLLCWRLNIHLIVLSIISFTFGPIKMIFTSLISFFGDFMFHQKQFQ